MSLWLLGLGGSVAYVLMKQQTINGSIERAGRQFENRHGQRPADGGFSVGDLNRIHDKGSKKNASETPASSELSKKEQSALNSAGSVFAAEEKDYDATQDPVGHIEGIYMEQVIPQI